MGEWIFAPRPAKQHFHDYPNAVAQEYGIIKGDEYRCECGMVFRVTSVGPVDKDLLTPLSWKPKPDLMPYDY